MSLRVDIQDADQARMILAELEAKGLSKATIQKYYGDLRREAEGQGVDTSRWPKAPAVPRGKRRDPIPYRAARALEEMFERDGFQPTRDLAVLVRCTGMRPYVEAMRSPLRVKPGVTFDTLTIETGKGGHSRSVPITHAEARGLLCRPERLAAMRACPYRTHTDRMAKAVARLKLRTRLPGFHALRHTYADSIYSKTKDRLLVQRLLGHASADTTERYIGEHDLEEVARELLQ